MSQKALLIQCLQIDICSPALLGYHYLNEKVCATVDKVGDLDAAFAYFIQDLQMPLPMGELFTNNLPKGLKDRFREAYYVEEATLGGVPCEHLALRNDMADAQVWIAKGDNPLLHRMVITYKREGSGVQVMLVRKC
jgi:hypothetical protein